MGMDEKKNVYTRDQLSRIASEWGWSFDGDADAMNSLKGSGNWSAADTGSLCRIATALESIVVLLDPVERSKLMREHEKEKQRDAKLRRREARRRVNVGRLRPFVLQRLRVMRPYTDGLPNRVASAIASAIWHHAYEFSRHPRHYQARPLNKLLRCNNEELFHIDKIYGIGPAIRREWDKAEGRCEDPPE